MNYVPLILFLVVVVGLLAFSARTRRRQSEAEQQRRESIQVGSQVMTTSGLYGTVTAMGDDETVQLSIAPGIEVKWAFAALRDAESLPERYAQGVAPPAAGPLSQRPPGTGLRKEPGTS